MLSGMDYRIVDHVLFVIANLVNILLVAFFLCRARGLRRVAHGLGSVVVALGVPVGLAVVLNLLGGREWWTVVLPSLLVAYLVVELILDYILKLDFRSTALLWPYLLTYYLGLMAMIGYSFGMGRAYGFVTLATYFLNLLATWYSYSRVGHG